MPKWGKIGSPKSAERKRFLARIRQKAKGAGRKRKGGKRRKRTFLSKRV